MQDRFLRAWFLAGVLGLAAGPALSQPKTLYWRAFDVRARLDDAGRLHVVEKQSMVFSGDWNGGERDFRIGRGQSLAFGGLERISADGERHPLASGDLSAVDQYAFKDPVTLRWRSRTPSDPPFDRTELVYEISYTLSGILTKLGSVYRLDHDFAFPDRVGPIQTFSLELTLDPAWESRTPVAPRITAGPLPPGSGYVLTLELAHHGASTPIAAAGTSRAIRRVVFLLFAAAVLALLVRFWSADRRAGRWAPMPDPQAIDDRWLEKNLFSLLPEEAGALWDEKIGASEVAALLARLSVEKKIESRPVGQKMSLSLLVPLEKFSGYEQSLISALFFGGRKETDTDAVRAHYKGKGFDPVAKIKPGIEDRLKAHADLAAGGEKGFPGITAGLLLSGLLLLVLAVVVGGHPWPDLLGWLISNGFVFVLAVIGASLFRKRLDAPAVALAFLWLPAYDIYSWYRRSAAPTGPGLLLLAGSALFQLGLVSAVFDIARIRASAARIALRKKLLAAQRFFARELRSPSPRLSDDWYPYVLALGLGPLADRWARSFATAPAAAAGVAVSSSGRSSGSSSSSGGPSPAGGWTGGGGSFGGAGASASWAAAAASISSGVSAPSSSSGGGGGGGGGGGSSGGGGGGGW